MPPELRGSSLTAVSGLGQALSHLFGLRPGWADLGLATGPKANGPKPQSAALSSSTLRRRVLLLFATAPPVLLCALLALAVPGHEPEGLPPPAWNPAHHKTVRAWTWEVAIWAALCSDFDPARQAAAVSRHLEGAAAIYVRERVPLHVTQDKV